MHFEEYFANKPQQFWKKEIASWEMVIKQNGSYNTIYKSILNNKYSKKKKETYGTYLEAFILFA